jgi:hypothetical protein
LAEPSREDYDAKTAVSPFMMTMMLIHKKNHKFEETLLGFGKPINKTQIKLSRLHAQMSPPEYG